MNLLAIIGEFFPQNLSIIFIPDSYTEMTEDEIISIQEARH
jgi:hypothetical protein